MNKLLSSIVDEIDRKLVCLTMNFDDTSWRETIPSEPGWYLIKTNTPLAVLKSIESPNLKHKAHIDIPGYITKPHYCKTLVSLSPNQAVKITLSIMAR